MRSAVKLLAILAAAGYDRQPLPEKPAAHVCATSSARYSVVVTGLNEPALLVDSQSGRTWKACQQGWCGPIAVMSPPAVAIDKSAISKCAKRCSGAPADTNGTVTRLENCLVLASAPSDKALTLKDL